MAKLHPSRSAWRDVPEPEIEVPDGCRVTGSDHGHQLRLPDGRSPPATCITISFFADFVIAVAFGEGLFNSCHCSGSLSLASAGPLDSPVCECRSATDGARLNAFHTYCTKKRQLRHIFWPFGTFCSLLAAGQARFLHAFFRCFRTVTDPLDASCLSAQVCVDVPNSCAHCLLVARRVSETQQGHS